MKKKICIITCSFCKYSLLSSLKQSLWSFQNTIGNPIDEKVKNWFQLRRDWSSSCMAISEQKGALNLAADQINATVVLMENKSKL